MSDPIFDPADEAQEAPQSPAPATSALPEQTPEPESKRPSGEEQAHDEGSGATLTDDEVAVLRMYAELEDRGISMTTESVAKRLHLTMVALRSAVTVLKSRDLLTGTRKFTATPKGREALLAYAAEPDPVREREDEGVVPVPKVVAPPSAAAGPAPSVPVVAEKRKLSAVLAEKLMVTPAQVWNVVKNQVISVSKSDPRPVTDEEVLHVLSVMNTYNLDPFLRQVYAFRHKGKLYVTVGIDGWIELAQRRPGFMGVTYRYPEEMVTLPNGRKCWPWVEATCHMRGRHPYTIVAFLDEWLVQSRGGEPSNWEDKPGYRLQMKAYTLAIRGGAGVSLYDDADYEQLKQAEYTEVESLSAKTDSNKTAMLEKLNSGPVQDLDPFAEDNDHE